MRLDGTTVAFVAERRHLADSALREAKRILEEEGVDVPLVVPGGEELYTIPEERPPWDAVVSRGRDLAGLGILAAAAALGVPAINRPEAIDLVRNKVAMQSVLRRHGLPLPRTWFAARAEVFRRIETDCFPLVVKPFDGDGARGIALLTRPADVDLLPYPEPKRSLYIAQEFLKTDGSDLKLYGIDARVWAVRKPSPIRFVGPGPAIMERVGGAELMPVDAELRDIGLTCGRACGLELWGVDVAITPHGPRVIEVNDFPTYSAVPQAGPAIAEHLITRVEMERVAQAAGRDRLHTIVREWR